MQLKWIIFYFQLSNTKNWKCFYLLWLLCTVEVWSISKILWYDTENNVVNSIQQALNNCLVFAWHYKDDKDEKTLGPFLVNL